MAEQQFRSLPTHFPLHKGCDWVVSPGTKGRVYNGTAFPVLAFEDQSCSVTETMPVDPSGQYVVISDGLCEEMGWKIGGFKFGGAYFFQYGRIDGREGSAYIPLLYLINDFGVCNFIGGRAAR